MSEDTEAKLLLKMFIREYELWERGQSRRGLVMPDYQKLGNKMFQAYKTAKQYGY